MARKSFLINSRVAFRTPRGRTGRGRIVDIRSTGRGDWYVVQPTGTQETLAVRVSALS